VANALVCATAAGGDSSGSAEEGVGGGGGGVRGRSGCDDDDNSVGVANDVGVSAGGGGVRQKRMGDPPAPARGGGSPPGGVGTLHVRGAARGSGVEKDNSASGASSEDGRCGGGAANAAASGVAAAGSCGNAHAGEDTGAAAGEASRCQRPRGGVRSGGAA
jgi:hypothetical protein